MASAYSSCLGMMFFQAPSAAVALSGGLLVQPPLLYTPMSLAVRRAPPNLCALTTVNVSMMSGTATTGVSSHGHSTVSVSPFLEKLTRWNEQGAGSAMLIFATCVSLTLANHGSTSACWMSLWSANVGPMIGGHALSVRGWINEGLMALFFFLVGLEIKQEIRCGSLATARTAALPCFAAVGGMVTPMLVYWLVQLAMPVGSLLGLAIPMATDIAFAMAVYGFFRKRMPPASALAQPEPVRVRVRVYFLPCT